MAQQQKIRPEERVSRDAQRLLAEYFRIRREYNSLDRNDPVHAPRRAALKERYFALDRQYTELIQARAALAEPGAFDVGKTKADVLWEGAFADDQPIASPEPFDSKWIEIETPAEGRATDEVFEEALRQVNEETETGEVLAAPAPPETGDLVTAAPADELPAEETLGEDQPLDSDENSSALEPQGSLGNLDRPNLSAVSALREIAEGLTLEEPGEGLAVDPEGVPAISAPDTPMPARAPETVSETAATPQPRVAHARGEFRPRKRGGKNKTNEIPCPSCGESLPAGTRVCTYCHARLTEGAAGESETVRHITHTNLHPPKVQEKPGLGPKVTVTAGWLVVLAGATWLIVRGAGLNRDGIDAWLQRINLGSAVDPQAGTILGASMVVLGIAVVGLGIFAGRFVRFVIPIHDLARLGRIDTIEKLILQGEDIDLRDDHGCTPLHFAVVARQREAAAVLVGNGADPNSHNDRGDTPLHLATANRDHALVQYLVNKGADVEALNESSSSLMHVAAWVGDASLVRLFAEHGLSIEARTKEGFTPLHFAAQSGYEEATAYLLERGAKVDAASNMGTTPLFAAVRNGHLPIVQRLVDAGANVNLVRASDHLTPIGLALAQNRSEIVEFLRVRGATEG